MICYVHISKVVLKIFQEDFSAQMPSTHLCINILHAQFEGVATWKFCKPRNSLIKAKKKRDMNRNKRLKSLQFEAFDNTLSFA